MRHESALKLLVIKHVRTNHALHDNNTCNAAQDCYRMSSNLHEKIFLSMLHDFNVNSSRKLWSISQNILSHNKQAKDYWLSEVTQFLSKKKRLKNEK